MYTIYVNFTCREGRREDYVERLRAEGVLDAVRAEDGCIKYDFYFSEKDANELLLIEAWESKEHQEVHIGQPHMAAMRAFRDEYILFAHLGEFAIK
ncbi:MAG: putative quinol monooxygenase [Eubacteriales bacterium]